MQSSGRDQYFDLLATDAERFCSRRLHPTPRLETSSVEDGGVALQWDNAKRPC